MLKPTLVLLACVATVRLAAAQPDAPAAARPGDPSVAITISPVHLVIPMAELAVEARLGDRVGVAAIGGIGMFRDQPTDTRISLFEAGASARYYVVGSFRTGLQLGGEVLYVHAATGDMEIEVRAAGLAVSPFIGAKWTHGSGFTLEGQGGVSFLALRAKADTGTMSERSGIGPLVNLNLGYSF